MQDSLHNKWQLTRQDFWLHYVSLVCYCSQGVLFLPILVRCSIFGRNGTSVTLQNRSAVSANFGLIDMSKLVEKGFQNVPVLACEQNCTHAPGPR